MLNWIDYLILAIVFFSTLISLARGFFREALSLLTWIAAFWVGFSFCKPMSVLLQNYIPQNTLRVIASFAVLFIVTLIAGSMINFIISRLVSRVGLGSFDRVLGILFGLGRGIVFVAIILIVTKAIVPVNDPLWTASRLAGYFNPLEVRLLDFLPNDIHMQLQAAQMQGSKTQVIPSSMSLPAAAASVGATVGNVTAPQQQLQSQPQRPGV